MTKNAPFRTIPQKADTSTPRQRKSIVGQIRQQGTEPNGTEDGANEWDKISMQEWEPPEEWNLPDQEDLTAITTAEWVLPEW